MWSAGKKGKASHAARRRWLSQVPVVFAKQPGSNETCSHHTRICPPSTGRQWWQVCQKSAEHCAVVPLVSGRHEYKQQWPLLYSVISFDKCINWQQLNKRALNYFKSSIYIPMCCCGKQTQHLGCCKDYVPIMFTYYICDEKIWRNVSHI